MKRTGSLLVGVLFWCFVLSTPAAAQPDFWGVICCPHSVTVINARSALNRAVQPAPAGVCLGAGAMSADVRWYFVPTNVGIARIDVATRSLLELTPRTGGCNSTIWVSPSGRWWHLLEPGTPSRVSTIDAVSKQVTREVLLPTSLFNVKFDPSGARRYELSFLSPSSRASIQGWNDGPSSSALWTVHFDETRMGGSAVVDFAVGPAGLYVVLQTTGGSAEIRRLDLGTGAELSRAQISFPTTASLSRKVAAFDGRVFLTAGVLNPVGPDRATLASFDALTLQPLAKVDWPGDTFTDVFLMAIPTCYTLRRCRACWAVRPPYGLSIRPLWF